MTHFRPYLRHPRRNVGHGPEWHLLSELVRQLLAYDRQRLPGQLRHGGIGTAGQSPQGLYCLNLIKHLWIQIIAVKPV